MWKGLYAELNVMPTWQTFVNTDGRKIDNGFQIFNTYRVGYHIKLFKDRFFIQPSIATTHRLYHTKMPDGFKQLDDKWSKFIVGEPGFHFGFNF
ncbi:endo-beta-N-acetylglucosaminidase D [Spirosoma sp. LMG 31448]|uniref:Endo-beta-N-acetylglucosaminidase D n=1 Tax=Spirosoma utsteinense TaxID=2585773 RepID=A0ABR6WF56_9BACT|nr:endo-beta-N-acetylglucosaminidase D [Spirosoma utsteinense]MBC3795167.1 endo-beta-N-acetylglucosaminidase D [Spirosoma utsteinense]